MTTITPIVSLPAAASVAATDLAVIVQGATTRKATVLQLQTITATGSTAARTLANRFADVVNVKDFGAVGDGVADDTAAVQAALNSPGAAGGTINIPNGVKLRVASNLTIPANVTLRGPYEFVGSPMNNTSAQYDALGGSIRLASTATITIMGGAGITGVLIYRYGMTFPAADSSAFAGTAITAGGDDVFVTNSMILGFALAYSSNTFQRPRIHNTFFDCLGGLLIANCADIGYITEVHGWPFATIAAIGPVTRFQRSGMAFQFTVLGDWNKVTNCFSYAYFRGVNVNSCNSMTLEGCGFDSTGSYAGQIGYLIDGTSNDTRISLGQAAAQDNGIYINTSAGLHTTITDTDTWACTSNGVVVVAGDVSISGVHRDEPTAVNITNGTSTVRINIRTSAVGSPVGVTVANNKIFIDPACDFYGWAAGSPVTNNAYNMALSVASASPVLLPANGTIFNLTGVTSFAAINGGWNGRAVTLVFSGILTVTNGGGLFVAGGTFTTAANSTLSLVHNGTAWYETGRKT